MKRFALLAPLITACASLPCECPAPALTAGQAPITLNWSDGDSGRYSQNGAIIAFRVHRIDTPETGRSKKRYLPDRPSGPKCEAEWDKGIAAYHAAIALTQGQTATITRYHGPDQFNRQVIDLAINGQDYGQAMTEAGHAQVWDFDGGQAKPDWCAA